MNLHVPITVYLPTKEECIQQGWSDWYDPLEYCVIVNNTYYWWRMLDNPFTLTDLTIDWIMSAYEQSIDNAGLSRTFNFANAVFHTDNLALDYPELLI